MAKESPAARAKRATEIREVLGEAYPGAECALRFDTPFQLLIATILSAQCTDAKVNEVTLLLFARYGTAETLAAADPPVVEGIIHATGFYRQKTKSILATARDLVAHHDGQVPKTLAELTKLRGVARKTANVVLGNAYGIPGLAIDTHMKRVHQRLSLVASDDPTKIERELMELVPEAHWTHYSHQVIHHGRVCCDAKKPQCQACPLQHLCPYPESLA